MEGREGYQQIPKDKREAGKCLITAKGEDVVKAEKGGSEK